MKRHSGEKGGERGVNLGLGYLGLREKPRKWREAPSHGREEKAPVIYSDLLIFRRKLIKLIPAKTLSGQIEEKQIENCGYLGQRESS